MNQIILPLTDYLKLSNGSLCQLRNNMTRCVTSTLPGSRLRLATLIAPVDHCWGMDFGQSSLYRKISETIENESLVQQVLMDCNTAVSSLNQIMQGLIPLQNIPFDGGFEYGSRGEPIDYWWFRSYVLTDNDALLEHFMQCWTRHEEQLGKYFLMPYTDGKVKSDGTGQNTQPWQNPEIPEKLFCTRIRPQQRSFKAKDLIDLLEEYQSEERARELDRTISPEFCLQEHVRIHGALLHEDPFFSKYVNGLASILLGSAYSPQIDIKRNIAILRIRIARTLDWPLGARSINAQLNERHIRLPASSILRSEAQHFINVAASKYPVLFEKFTAKIR